MACVLSCLPIARKKNDVASRMKSIREELIKINEQFHGFNFTNGDTTTPVEQLIDDPRETSSCLPAEPIIGRSREKQEIINLLSAGTNNEETLIVAIYGLGGLGKSTLAQQIYNDDNFKKLYDHRIWVYVSRHFSLKKIGSSIISQLPIGGGQQNRDTLEDIHRCFDTQLCGKKVMIVLDDLWEEKDTELRKLRSMLHVGKKGSMIDVIVTTRSEDIARKVSTSEAYMLHPLKADTCWEIIKRTSKFEEKHNQQSLKQIGLDIAKKCEGVALAAQAVGYLLQSKDFSGWKQIEKSDIWNEYSEADGWVLPSLKLSYEQMPPQLRICFTYCAIFQKGHNIVEDDLIHQWVALDFIKPWMGKEYIRQLLGMSFLQVSKLPANFGGHMVRYTMHDLVHDLATLIMADELIASDVALKSIDEHGQKYCRYASVANYDVELATKLSCTLPSKVRALHFLDSNKLDLSSGAFSFPKCLRILDFSGCSSVQLPGSIGKLNQLKYLLAPRMQNEILPEYITELAKLQYLNLNGSSGISALPESIGKLAGCLEFLDLSGCSDISKLPESIGDLKCMMCLHMSGCSGIKELPESLGNLTNLQRLELSGCYYLEAVPESLCGLIQLQYLNLEACRRIQRLPKNIGCLVDLQYFNLSRCAISELPESFKRLVNLLHLELQGFNICKGIPGALCGLTALQNLDMSDHTRMVHYERPDLPDAMRNLTNLKVLRLPWCLDEYCDMKKNDGYLDFIGTLTNLECLDLSYNNKLEYLPDSIGNLKRLHTLNLKGCWSLKSLPETFIAGPARLKSLVLDGCSNKLMDQASSLLHNYSLITLPLFMVRANDVTGHSNLHLLQDENSTCELSIVFLENVRIVEEARRIELSAKQNIRKLTLSWTKHAKRYVKDKDLFRELVTPRNLESLRLNNYGGPSFPSWFMDTSQHFPSLTRIELVGLPNCINLPPLGQIPCLEILELKSAPSITKIDSGFYGGKGAFPRLKRIEVYGMDSLEEWNTTYSCEDDGVEEFMFPVLEYFYVFSCPRLRLKPCPPQCCWLYIVDCDQIISSLQDAESSSHNLCSSTPTTNLTISHSDCLSFRLFHHFPALQSLDLDGCQNLAGLPEGIKQLSSLQYLHLRNCDSISALPEWLSDISSLIKLNIEVCTGIKSLPQCIQHLTNLKTLSIWDNQELERWCESEENRAKLAHIKDITFNQRW